MHYRTPCFEQTNTEFTKKSRFSESQLFHLWGLFSWTINKWLYPYSAAIASKIEAETWNNKKRKKCKKKHTNSSLQWCVEKQGHRGRRCSPITDHWRKKQVSFSFEENQNKTGTKTTIQVWRCHNTTNIKFPDTFSEVFLHNFNIFNICSTAVHWHTRIDGHTCGLQAADDNWRLIYGRRSQVWSNEEEWEVNIRWKGSRVPACVRCEWRRVPDWHWV